MPQDYFTRSMSSIQRRSVPFCFLVLVSCTLFIIGYLYDSRKIQNLEPQWTTWFALRSNHSIHKQMLYSAGSLQAKIKSAESLLGDFIGYISYQRTNILQSMDNSSSPPREFDRDTNRIYGYDFEALSKDPGVFTVFLKQPIDNMKQWMIPEYFPYTASDCVMAEKKSIYGMGYSKTHFNTPCHEELDVKGHELQEVTLNVGISEKFQQEDKVEKMWTYLHIIKNGLVDENGDVRTERTTIVPKRCKMDQSIKWWKQRTPFPVYDEIFVISQYWGSAFYHSTVEDMPRIAPYLPFLRSHPNIKIHHFPVSTKYLQLLNISNLEKRSVSGSVVGRVVYSPSGNPCGRSPFLNTQLYSMYLQQSIEKNQTRDHIILIKRSHKRFFNHHREILKMLHQEAKPYNLQVKVFGDNPLPGFEETADMFHRAVMVVAPHGAGEANLVFSRPGTVVIEGLCYDETGRTNLCYRNLAQALGLRYHGIVYTSQCMNIKPAQLRDPVRLYLKIIT